MLLRCAVFPMPAYQLVDNMGYFTYAAPAEENPFPQKVQRRHRMMKLPKKSTGRFFVVYVKTDRRSPGLMMVAFLPSHPLIKKNLSTCARKRRRFLSLFFWKLFVPSLSSVASSCHRPSTRQQQQRAPRPVKPIERNGFRAFRFGARRPDVSQRRRAEGGRRRQSQTCGGVCRRGRGLAQQQRVVRCCCRARGSRWGEI